MKRVKPDCCEQKPHSCRGVMKTVLGVGMLCAVIHAVHTWMETVRGQTANFEDYQD